MLAVPRTREPGPQSGRLRHQPHGHRRGDRRARQEGQPDPRLPQLLPPPRHEGRPLRPGQLPHLHLPLPRMDLRHHGTPRGRRIPALPRGLLRNASQGGVGPRRGRPVQELLRLPLGDLGPEGAVVRGVPRPLRREPSPLPAGQRRHGRGPGHVHPVPAPPPPHQLEGARLHLRHRPHPHGDDPPLRRCCQASPGPRFEGRA